jgi:hypothetical protein
VVAIGDQSRRHCTDLATDADDVLLSAFISQHLWIHQTWSPVGDLAALVEVATKELASLDRAASAAVWIDDPLTRGCAGSTIRRGRACRSNVQNGGGS